MKTHVNLYLKRLGKGINETKNQKKRQRKFWLKIEYIRLYGEIAEMQANP